MNKTVLLHIKYTFLVVKLERGFWFVLFSFEKGLYVYTGYGWFWMLCKHFVLFIFYLLFSSKIFWSAKEISLCLWAFFYIKVDEQWKFIFYLHISYPFTRSIRVRLLIFITITWWRQKTITRIQQLR